MDTSGTRHIRAWDIAQSTASSTGGEVWITYDDYAQIIKIAAIEGDPRIVGAEITARQARGLQADKRIRARRQWHTDSQREIKARASTPQGISKFRRWSLALRRG